MSKHKETIASFKDLMGGNVALLRCMGLFFMDCVFTGKPKRPGALETVFTSAGLVLVSLMVAFTFRTVLLVWEEDIVLSLNLMPIAISAALCTFKGLRLLEKSRDITYLLNKLGDLWDTFVERRRNEAEVSRMIRIVTGHRNLYLLVIMGAFPFYVIHAHIYILGQVFITKNEYNSFNYSLTVFPLVYPFPRSNALSYSLCVSLEHLVVLSIGLFWSSCDSVFAQVTTHVAIHFENLRYDIEHGFCTDGNFPGNENIDVQELISIAKRHSELFSLCHAIENIFSPIILLTTLMTAANLCFCLYQMEMMLTFGEYMETVKNLAHFLILFSAIVTYCGFASMLTDKAKMISDGVYGSQWYGCDRRAKRFLMIMMIRSQKPYYLTAYGFFPITLNQITTIFNTSLSYFMMLKTMA